MNPTFMFITRSTLKSHGNRQSFIHKVNPTELALCRPAARGLNVENLQYHTLITLDMVASVQWLYLTCPRHARASRTNKMSFKGPPRIENRRRRTHTEHQNRSERFRSVDKPGRIFIFYINGSAFRVWVQFTVDSCFFSLQNKLLSVKYNWSASFILKIYCQLSIEVLM